MNDEYGRDLLLDFIHENEDLEKLEDIVDEFNIFEALRLINSEIRHSNFLTWLLSPNESHGLGDYFLTSFLKKLSFKASHLKLDGPSIFDIDGWNLTDAEILREWKNVDIFIKCDSQKFVCAIENKIYSKEHSGQLGRYKNAVNQEFPEYNKFFVYLTIEEDHPSDESYIPMSHNDISQLVEHLIARRKDKLGNVN